MKKYFIICFLSLSLFSACDQAEQMGSSMSPAKTSSSQGQSQGSGNGKQQGSQIPNNAITYQSVNFHNNGLTEFILASQSPQGVYEFYYWTSKNATKIKMETLPNNQGQVRGSQGRLRFPGRDEIFSYQVQAQGMELIHSNQKRQMYSPF